MICSVYPFMSTQLVAWGPPPNKFQSREFVFFLLSKSFCFCFILSVSRGTSLGFIVKQQQQNKTKEKKNGIARGCFCLSLCLFLLTEPLVFGWSQSEHAHCRTSLHTSWILSYQADWLPYHHSVQPPTCSVLLVIKTCTFLCSTNFVLCVLLSVRCTVFVPFFCSEAMQ